MIIIIVIYRHDLSRMEIHFHRRVSCFSDWGVAVTNLVCLTEQDYPRTLSVCSVSESVVRGLKLSIHFFFLVAQQPLVGQDRLIIETLRSHSVTPHSVGLLWTNARCTHTHTHNTHKRRKSMPPAVFEPTIPVSEQPQTHTLGRAAAGNYVQYFVNQI